jgi:hypothetical protein
MFTHGLSAVELLSMDAESIFGRERLLDPRPYEVEFGNVRYNKDLDGNLHITVTDGESILRIEVDRLDADACNMGYIDSGSDLHHVDVEPDRVEAMAEYMLHLIIAEFCRT